MSVETTIRNWEFATTDEGWAFVGAGEPTIDDWAYGLGFGDGDGGWRLRRTSATSTGTREFEIVDTWANLFSIPADSTVLRLMLGTGSPVVNGYFRFRRGDIVPRGGNTAGPLTFLDAADAVIFVYINSVSVISLSWANQVALQSSVLNIPASDTVKIRMAGLARSTSGANSSVHIDEIQVVLEYNVPDFVYPPYLQAGP